ncbi:MAG: prenyltransferase [Chloroflexota bacterium]
MPVCVFTGIAASLYDGIPLNVLHLVLAFIGALCAHIGVNVLNDYFDYKSGIDLKTMRTPFSGGSGILPAASMKPRHVLLLGLSNLAIVLFIGIYFITVYKWAILPIGLAGILIIYLYTPYLTKLSYVTEFVGPGLGFGLMVLGTYFTQSGTYSASALIVSLVAGLLIANLLLLNEFPDVEADRSVGRKHLPIILGTGAAAMIYCVIAILAYIAIIAGVVANILPPLALLGLLTVPLGVKAMKSALKNHNHIKSLLPALGTNVLVVLLTPLLMSIGVLVGYLVG